MRKKPVAARPTAVEPVVEVVPISAGLGLADIRATVPAGAWRSATVIVRPAAQAAGAAAPLLSVPMAVLEPARDPNEPVPTTQTWAARVMVPGAAQPAGSAQPAENAALVFHVEPSAGPSAPPAKATPPAALVTQPPAEVATPDWAKGRVWYQVFPERFRNGNPGNDPAGQAVFNPGWSSDWNRVSVEELEAARARAAGGVAGAAGGTQSEPFLMAARSLPANQAGGAKYNVVFSRRYGGDLQGVAEKLPYLADLGVTGLYMTPIFRSASLHKYDAADFRHVDDTLGDPGDGGPKRWQEPGETVDPATWSWTRADRFVLDTLLPRAREQGIRVMFDGVWNHTGREFFAFRDMLEHGAESPFAEWYNGTFAPPAGTLKAGDPLERFKPGTLLNWKAWDSASGSLPSFRQTGERDLVPPVKRHIFDVSARWLAPDGQAARGIDGWRLDVAPDIGVAFWRDWRAHVKKLNPDALLIGEIWFPAANFFNGNGFDGQMNYPLAFALVNWLGTDPRVTTSTRLARRLERDVVVNHPAIELVQMNLLDSHDTDRLVSMLHNPRADYDRGGRPTGRPGAYRGERPPRECFELAILGIAFLATYQGSPMIYNGDELGMHGADDPDNRMPLAWPDLAANESPEQRPQMWVHGEVRSWLRLRQHPEIGEVLRLGMVRHRASGSPEVFVFERRLNDRVVTVVLNRSDQQQSVRVEGVAEPVRVGARSGEVVGANGQRYRQ